MKGLFLLTSLMLSVVINAQTNVNLYFPPKVEGNDLIQNTNVTSLSGTEMSIDFFNYYISNVHIIHDGGQDLDLSDTVFIVTVEDPILELGMLDLTNIESIDFGVGVPQSLNHEDIVQYEEGHPLSWQTPSMHWGWTSGYKFLLINGYGDSNNDGTADELFQIHSLGDGNYKNVSMAVIPTVGPTETTIVINCNLDEWMYGMNPGSVGVHHGTTGVNAAAMNNVNTRPVFTLPNNASMYESTGFDGTLSHHVKNEIIVFSWSDVNAVYSYRLIDMNGKEVQSGQVSETTGSLEITDLRSGTYIFYLLSDDMQPVQLIKVLR